MTSEEIKEMFQANAALRQSFPADPAYPALLNTVQKLTAKYINESIGSGEIEQPKQMKIEEALNILINACKTATYYEAEKRPNGMTDEQVTKAFDIRKAALDCVVEKLANQMI